MTDKEAIQWLFWNIAEAWNQGHGDLYASYFTDPADYVTYRGTHLRTRKEIANYHDRLFKGLLKGSTLHGEIKSIRFITDHMAIVHQTGTIKLPFQRQPPASRRSINTNLLIRTKDTWEVTAFHNCRIRKESSIVRILQRLYLKLR